MSFILTGVMIIGCIFFETGISAKGDGVSGSPSDVIEPGKNPVYRLYNPNSGEHFYTLSDKERVNVAKAGWNYEGIGWYAPDKNDRPVYRLYNKVGGEHHYTLDKKEKNSLVKAGWNYEGIGWYSASESAVPIYREYNPNQFSCNHNFTADIKEHSYLVSIGWKNEGIAWYAVEVGVPVTPTPTKKPNVTPTPTIGPGGGDVYSNYEFGLYAMTAERHTDDNMELFKRELELVNALRKKKGLKPFVLDEKLCYMAQFRSQEMCKLTGLTHIRPDGRRWYTIKDDYTEAYGPGYYTYFVGAENIAYGQKTADEVIGSWTISQDHYKHLVSADYTRVGFGKEGYFWTMLFAM